MSIEHFSLVYREADLREIYHDKLHYKLFSKDNYDTILLILLFFALTLFSVFNNNPERASDKFFLALCFFAGFAYQLIQLLKRYWDFKKSNENIETWIKEIRAFRGHEITFGDSFFKYKRDNDEFTYDFNNIVTTYRTDALFFLETAGNNVIIIPKKSFASGEFEKFLEAFDSRRK